MERQDISISLSHPVQCMESAISDMCGFHGNPDTNFKAFFVTGVFCQFNGDAVWLADTGLLCTNWSLTDEDFVREDGRSYNAVYSSVG